MAGDPAKLTRLKLARDKKQPILEIDYSICAYSMEIDCTVNQLMLENV